MAMRFTIKVNGNRTSIITVFSTPNESSQNLKAPKMNFKVFAVFAAFVLMAIISNAQAQGETNSYYYIHR